MQASLSLSLLFEFEINGEMIKQASSALFSFLEAINDEITRHSSLLVNFLYFNLRSMRK